MILSFFRTWSTFWAKALPCPFDRAEAAPLGGAEECGFKNPRFGDDLRDVPLVFHAVFDVLIEVKGLLGVATEALGVPKGLEVVPAWAVGKPLVGGANEFDGLRLGGCSVIPFVFGWNGFENVVDGAPKTEVVGFAEEFGIGVKLEGVPNPPDGKGFCNGLEFVLDPVGVPNTPEDSGGPEVIVFEVGPVGAPKMPEGDDF